MKSIPAWVSYTVLRLLFFAVPLAVLLLLPLPLPWTWHWLLSVVAAAVIGLCLSYLLLRRPREALSHDLYALRHGEREQVRDDDEVEDAAVDASGSAADYAPSVRDSMAGREPRAWRGARPKDAAADSTTRDAASRDAGSDPERDPERRAEQ